MPSQPRRSPPADEARPAKEWGFKEWFFAGCLLGIIYGLFRHPLALGCLFLIVLLFAVLVLYFYWTWIALAVVAVTAIWVVRRRMTRNEPD